MVPGQCCAPHCSVSVVFPEHGAPPFVGGIHARIRFRSPSQVAEQCPQGSQSLSTPSTVHLLTLQHGLLMLLFNIYYFGNNQISKGKFLSSCQTMYAEREHLYLDSVVHHTVLCRSYFPNTVLRRLSEEYMPGSASVDPHRWLNNVPKVTSLSAHHQL